jgi:hypothetical protein
MVRLRRRGERSLKPSRFLLAGEKPACFLNPKAGAYGFLNIQADLSTEEYAELNEGV